MEYDRITELIISWNFKKNLGSILEGICTVHVNSKYCSESEAFI